MDQNNGGIIGKINTPTTTVASGVWSLDSQFESQAGSTWPLAFPQTTIANSCRFDDASVDHLSRTPSSAGSNRKFTFSAWVKRSHPSNEITMVTQNNSANNARDCIRFNGGDQVLRIFLNDASTASFVSNAQFRDVSAWYNVVVNADTTQATASNRLKAYINGEQITSWHTNTEPSLNADLLFNSDNLMFIGRDSKDNNTEWEGYMAEVIFVDGQQLEPTLFGATNPVTNIWEPIAYAGTYGTNGFRLDFADSSALGNDVSGNNNDFTANNLTSVDQSTDTCSNNFATLNPIDKPTNSSGSSGTLPTLSNGNLSVVNTNSAFREARSTYYLTTGKWYWETKMTRLSNTLQVGVVLNNYSAGSGERRMYQNDGNKYISSSSSYGATFTTNDIIGIALNLDDGEITFYKNGTTQGVAATDLVSGIDGTGWTPAVNCFDADCDFNFGSPPYSISSGNADANGHGNFEYAVPSGYFALNTKNLAEYG